MNHQPNASPTERYAGMDVHKHYTMVGGMPAVCQVRPAAPGRWAGYHPHRAQQPAQASRTQRRSSPT